MTYKMIDRQDRVMDNLYLLHEVSNDGSIDTTEERELNLEHSVQMLRRVNQKIAKLNQERESITDSIIGMLEHAHEGQKTYEVGAWKIECKTPMTYVLDTKKYKSGEIIIDSAFNPVKESISYTLDKKLCDKYMSIAPENVRNALAELITKKPGKVSVTVKERLA